MKVIVCGAGPVGAGIAEQLVNEGNDVTIIGMTEVLLDKIRHKLDLNCVLGFPSHPSILKAAGAGDADMIIAVTDSDEINMVTSYIASNLFGVKKKIAHIRHHSYLGKYHDSIFSTDTFPIDLMISPEKEVAKAISNRLHVPGANETFLFSGEKIKVISVKFSKDSIINRLTIKQANAKLSKSLKVKVFGFLRDQEFSLKSDIVLNQDDEIYLAADSNDIKEVLSLLGHEEPEARNIRIVGGGRVGYSLATSLGENSAINIKIIEHNAERARFLAAHFPDIAIINGNALEKEILREVNIENSDMIISVSNDDEVNILSSLLAKKFGCNKAIALINSSSFAPLFSSLGIDVIVNPREISVSSILRYTRDIKSRNVFSICEGQAEIIETISYDNSYTSGKKLSELKLPEGIDITAILRHGKTVIPFGDTMIEAGDSLIIVSYVSLLKKVEKIFSHKFKYV
ncbi:MAG: Trk system potassium transporter TrkA [Rickettsiales bacterium]|jgi:trk system potassium uptake protein|nr:Trk system potassium transporter TrkA [Rickettsiales bacterium]